MASSFDFNKMLEALGNYVQATQQYISQLEQSSTSGTVNLGMMFQLQFRMEMMSQFIEATSNCLSNVHQEMITMARATKGQ